MAVSHVTPEEFRKEIVRPGTKAHFLVRVGEMSTGSEVVIPVLIVAGRREGPRLFITAGQQADETAGVEAVKRFGAQLNPDEVAGTIVVVPLQNPPAWAFRSPLYPYDAPTVANLFTLDYGDPKGIMTARVLSALVDSIALNADYALDVHATHLDSVNYPFTFVFSTSGESPQVPQKRAELARQVGYEIIYIWPTQAGGLTSILQSRGCPTVAIQAGEGWRVLEPFPSILIRGIRNFCKALDVLGGDIELPAMQIEITNRHEVRVNRGGMLHLYVSPGKYVQAGQVVGEVRDMFDGVMEEIRTPVNGIVVRCSLFPIVATGGRVCNVFQTDRGEEWESRLVPELERQISIPSAAPPRE